MREHVISWKMLPERRLCSWSCSVTGTNIARSQTWTECKQSQPMCLHTRVLALRRECCVHLVFFSHLSYRGFYYLLSTCREEPASSCSLGSWCIHPQHEQSLLQTAWLIYKPWKQAPVRSCPGRTAGSSALEAFPLRWTIQLAAYAWVTDHVPAGWWGTLSSAWVARWSSQCLAARCCALTQTETFFFTTIADAACFCLSHGVGASPARSASHCRCSLPAKSASKDFSITLVSVPI